MEERTVIQVRLSFSLGDPIFIALAALGNNYKAQRNRVRHLAQSGLAHELKPTVHVEASQNPPSACQEVVAPIKSSHSETLIDSTHPARVIPPFDTSFMTSDD